MKPKYKFLLLILVLQVPYFGFIAYLVTHFPSNHIPVRYVDTLLVWFVANFLIALLLGKRIFRGQVVDAEKAHAAVATSITVSNRLVIFWILFFLYGVIETVRGKIPLNRAIPAGAFLLFFIGIIGWSAYRMKRAID